MFEPDKNGDRRIPKEHRTFIKTSVIFEAEQAAGGRIPKEHMTLGGGWVVLVWLGKVVCRNFGRYLDAFILACYLREFV